MAKRTSPFERLLLSGALLVVGLFLADFVIQTSSVELLSVGFDLVNGYILLVVWANRKSLRRPRS